MAYPEDKGKAKIVSDSKGNGHYMMFQELSMSCGPACVAMAESHYKLQCMVDPEKRAREISQKYAGNWTAKGGTNVTNLSYVLNAEGVKCYAGTDIPDNKVFSYLSHYVTDRTPTIAHIAWTSGGHFVLVRRIYGDGTIVFLDPWYGLVEMKKDDLPKYTPIGATGKLSGWLNITYR
ncbi:MAG: C39 family peptidase [Aridibacter famidurans]|nr:C39 family peptidase [Aridibacter famidurans]